MDGQRAQDLLRHVLRDADRGALMMMNSSIVDNIYMVNKILPDCLKKAQKDDVANDIGFFQDVIRLLRPIALDKIRKEKHLWVLYCDSTGYPYMVDDDLIVLFDYSHHEDIETQILAQGYKITTAVEDTESFKAEVFHMYRNGYKNIRFIDGTSNPFVVSREELYEYDDNMDDDYVTNPALECTMIKYFQEIRKPNTFEGAVPVIQKHEKEMISAIKNAEFMVPCTKVDNGEEVEIQHPFIDVTERIKDRADDEKVIAIPVFTDGYEMDKVYEGHHENMLYTYAETVELVEELGASGIIINTLGISHFMRLDVLKSL